MKNNRNKSSRALLSTVFVISLLAAVSVSVKSQNAAPDYSKVVIKTTKIANNFYELEGQGGNIGVLTGPDGILMVDTEFAPLTDKIVAAIKQVSTAPIRFVINTHVHGDHTGGDENFAKLGATIFAREELRERLAHPSPGANGVPGTPAPQGALPVVTYSSPLKFHMNGEEADAIPILHAHTDGDTMVRFHVADVIMSGDFYRSAGYPNIDRINGGSLNGMVTGLATLSDLAGPNTAAVAGHPRKKGPVWRLAAGMGAPPGDKGLQKVRETIDGRQDLQQRDLPPFGEDPPQRFAVFRLGLRRTDVKGAVLPKVHVRMVASPNPPIRLLVLLIELEGEGVEGRRPGGHWGQLRTLQRGCTMGVPGLFGNQIVV